MEDLFEESTNYLQESEKQLLNEITIEPNWATDCHGLFSIEQLETLKLQIGDTLQLLAQSYAISHALTNEPDKDDSVCFFKNEIVMFV